MCCRIRKGFAPSNPKPMNACVMSKIPASNPPQKMAARGRGGESATVAAREEVAEVLMEDPPFDPIYRPSESAGPRTGKPASHRSVSHVTVERTPGTV